MPPHRLPWPVCYFSRAASPWHTTWPGQPFQAPAQPAYRDTVTPLADDTLPQHILLEDQPVLISLQEGSYQWKEGTALLTRVHQKHQAGAEITPGALRRPWEDEGRQTLLPASFLGMERTRD